MRPSPIGLRRRPTISRYGSQGPCGPDRVDALPGAISRPRSSGRDPRPTTPMPPRHREHRWTAFPLAGALLDPALRAADAATTDGEGEATMEVGTERFCAVWRRLGLAGVCTAALLVGGGAGAKAGQCPADKVVASASS